MSVQKGKETKLILLSDVENDNNSEIYKLLSEDINFFQSFFNFDDLIQTIQTQEQFEKFITSEDFQQFQLYFDQFIKHKNIDDFHWILQILLFFSEIRLRLHPIIVFLYPIFLNNYSNSLPQIKKFIKERKNSYFYSLLYSIFYESIDIDQIILSKDKQETTFLPPDTIKYLISLYPQTFDITFIDPNSPSIEEENKIFQFIYNDDYDQLVSYFSERPTFNIHANINITKSPKLTYIIHDPSISFFNFCCLVGSPKCFKYFILNECKPDHNTGMYCIIGGSLEIIQILNQQNFQFDTVFIIVSNIINMRLLIGYLQIMYVNIFLKSTV